MPKQQNVVPKAVSAAAEPSAASPRQRGKRTQRRLERGRLVAERMLARPGEVLELVSAVRVRLAIIRTRQRAAVHLRFRAPASEQPGPRVLAIVTHLTSGRYESAMFVERLAATLDGLLLSLGHTQLEIALITLPGRHVVDELPDHQRERIRVVTRSEDGDPWFLEFEAQDVFAARIDEFDWFVFLEDDLVLHDPLVLDKLAFFNEAAPPDALLLPHRYEVWQSRKVCIDLRSSNRPGEDWTVGRLTAFEAGGWKFAEFPNPHAAFYAVTQAQMHKWLATGRSWYKLCSFFGPLESAATGCLEECFRLYKPHPDNPHFLEIEHFGTKYSEMHVGIHGADDVLRSTR
jgi:hypothetical protein